ncbi:hypothetical protein C7N31_RS06025 [Enterococcus hirae]|uniref:hypothetical protein n=1 Tax=Enterococcus hirae TaxID=1354 RepID=UPI0015F284E1|nr:hypothetical protein [Enterococcus hirae]EMF0268082.1 hypothetical protein [Enterococcus hirae]EMF0300511.1 hypothetical protein [Enterococcus hirae]MBA5275146.1 hypothetical protein [Enterococcus hirae]
MAKLDGAIKFLLQTIADQLNFSNDPKNMLLQNLETYLPDIYQYSELIMNGVIKPIAYSVLGFLLLLEFQQMAQKIYGNYSGFGGMELFLPLFLKLGVSLLIMRHLTIFIHMIVEISTTISNGISQIGIREGGSKAVDALSLIEGIYHWGFFEKLTLLIILLIPLILSVLTSVLTKLVIFMRFFEIYLYFSISPLPLVTFLNEEVSSIGKNFLKLVCASSLQGILLFIILSFYPLLVHSVFSIDEKQGMIAVISGISGNCLTLCASLFYTNKWAKIILATA